MSGSPPSRRYALWWLVPFAIAALAFGRWFSSPEAKPGGRRGSEGPAVVEAVTPEIRALSAQRELSGSLEPNAEIVLVAEVSGVAVRVDADLGDPVEPGQVIAQLDDRVYRQQVSAARAELAMAEAEAAGARTAGELAGRALSRADALAERAIASERELDDSRAAAHRAEAEIAMSAARVARARAALASARLDLERTAIRGRWSEEAGPRNVAQRHLDEGARVAIGEPLFTLVDSDPLVFAAMVGPSDRARLDIGARVELEGPSGERLEGRVARVAPAFDPETRQARVEIEVPNAEGALQPGVFVRARAAVSQVEDAFVVPAVAVVEREGRSVVFVVDGEGDAHARVVPVEVALEAGEEVALRGEGLGGPVVVLGQRRLRDGAAVRVVRSQGGERMQP